ncbi:hypothetical protein H1C71_035931, partial [Ictidomys tridecemlineatus]
VELSAFSDGYQKSTVHQVLVLVLVFQSHLPATPPFIALSSPGLPSDRPREGPLPTSSRWKARLGKSMQNVGTSAGHVSGASVGPQDLEDMELSHFQGTCSLSCWKPTEPCDKLSEMLWLLLFSGCLISCTSED